MKSGKLYFMRNTFFPLFTLLFLFAGSGSSYAAKTDNQITSEDKNYAFVIKWNEPSKLIELPSAGSPDYANAYEFPVRIKAAAMSPDSRYLATVNQHEAKDSIRIYDIGKKKLINVFYPKKPMHTYIHTDIWFTHDNTGLYIPGAFGFPLIKINILSGDITSFEKIPGLEDYKPIHVCISHDRKYLAVEAESSEVPGGGQKVRFIRYIAVYNLSTMKVIKCIQTDMKYDGYLTPPTDLYFTDDSQFLNYYYSAPDPGLSNFFNMSYGKGTRQYAVSDLHLTAKNFEPRTVQKEPISVGSEYVTRISDGRKFRMSSSLSSAFMNDDPDFKPLSSLGKDISSSSSNVYSDFPAGMSEIMKRNASANGKYAKLVQVIQSTNLSRADATPSAADLSIYGSIQFSGVKTEAGYKVFLPPYLFIWEREQKAAADTAPKIETEMVSVGGMNSARKMQYDLRVEVTYVKRTHMYGSMDISYKMVRSAVVKEYRFSGYNAEWTKLTPAPSAFLEEDKKKWSERDVPLFYVRINMLDIWFNLRNFNVD